MAVTGARRFSWTPDLLNNWSGGFAVPGRQDSEWESFQSMELLRDGFPASRLGSRVHNTNAFSAQIVGMFRASLAGVGDVLLCATSTATWRFRVATPFSAGTYTALTVTQAPGVVSAVRMEQQQDQQSTQFLFAACATFNPGLISWDGTTVANVTGTPAGLRFVRAFNQRLYAAGNAATPNTVYFSDAGAPTSFPSANNFDVPSSRGAITGLERTSAGLLIFCERGIYLMLGDPPLNFRVVPIHDGIGADIPNAIITLGNLTLFTNNGDIWSYTGDVNNMTERMRGIANVSALGTNSTNATTAWAAITPLYYFFRPNMNILTNGTATTATSSALSTTYIFDRQRSGWFSVWTYPPESAPGTSNPFIPVAYTVNNVLFFNGGDGNVYYQTTRFMDLTQAQGTFEAVSFTPDQGGTNLPDVDVLSSVRTRVRYISDPNLRKQSRLFNVGGICKAGTGSLSVRLDDLGTYRTQTVVSGATFPVDVIPVLGANSTVDYNGIAIEVSGRNLLLRSINHFFRGIRWSNTAQLS